MQNLLIFTLFSLLVVNTTSAAELCDSGKATTMDIVVNTNHVTRAAVPPQLFGFNMPWHAFQLGLQESGVVKPALIDWLKPFKGALYRYPGGSPSNEFDWKNSIKPIAERQAMHYEYNQEYIPEFGYAEFLSFLQQVNGRAVVTLNMVGPRFQASSPEEVGVDAVQFVNWMQNESSARCVGIANCPIQYLELGNELDWSHSWTGEMYSTRANHVIAAVGDKVPAKSWIANGKTAPWDNPANFKREHFDQFNKAVAAKLPTNIENIAYHPYYDGITVPNATQYSDAYYAVWKARRKSAAVIVTEHARWPSKPLVGPWNDRWYEATGQGGAISSADYILSVLPDEKIRGATWHSLGVLGPWQLIHWDKKENTLYPSPVYWGMRTLRDAFLTDTLEISPAIQTGGGYRGGYSMRLVAMQGDGKLSLLGINRSNRPVMINTNWLGKLSTGSTITMRYTSALPEIDNDDTNKTRVVMKTTQLKGPNTATKLSICVPANAVFSVIF